MAMQESYLQGHGLLAGLSAHDGSHSLYYRSISLIHGAEVSVKTLELSCGCHQKFPASNFTLQKLIIDFIKATVQSATKSWSRSFQRRRKEALVARP